MHIKKCAHMITELARSAEISARRDENFPYGHSIPVNWDGILINTCAAQKN